MESRHRVLVAAQPAAWPVLKDMLEELVELVPVHAMSDAMQVLEHDPVGIDLIICTLTFSDHQILPAPHGQRGPKGTERGGHEMLRIK
jgi:hypothetical protein